MKKPVIPGLSKSRYLHGLQCPKYLWLETWRKELKTSVTSQLRSGLPKVIWWGRLPGSYFQAGLKSLMKG